MSPDDPLRERLISCINRLGHEELVAADRFLSHLAGNRIPVNDTSTRPLPGSPASQSGVEPPHSKAWPHAPVHRLGEAGTFIVTAGTWQKHHHFRGPQRLGRLESELLTLARQFGWHLEAWAVFSNHYHFVGHSPSNPAALRIFLGILHTKTAELVNQLDGAAGRKVWHNFWETKLTYERSYLARLHYVHQNPVKHGLVRVANQYPFCSAAWFERTATRAQVKTIYSFKIDKLKVLDDFEVVY
jgi:putative transposase